MGAVVSMIVDSRKNGRNAEGSLENPFADTGV